MYTIYVVRRPNSKLQICGNELKLIMLQWVVLSLSIFIFIKIVEKTEKWIRNYLAIESNQNIFVALVWRQTPCTRRESKKSDVIHHHKRQAPISMQENRPYSELHVWNGLLDSVIFNCIDTEDNKFGIY